MDHLWHLVTYIDPLGVIRGPRMESESLLSHPFQTRKFWLHGPKLNKNAKFSNEKRKKDIVIQLCSEKSNSPPKSTQHSALC